MSQGLRPDQTLGAYHLLKWLVVSPLLHTVFRIEIGGAQNVPASGGVLLASNHASHLDPLILASCARRPVAFMAKEELFVNPVLRRVMRTYGAFPVRRGTGDRGAIRTALEALELGWAVGIFVGGTRTDNGRIETPQLGTAMIAAKAQVPVVPVAIDGSGLVLPRGRKFPHLATLRCVFGEALSPPAPASRRDALEASTEHYTHAVHRLLQDQKS